MEGHGGAAVGSPCPMQTFLAGAAAIQFLPTIVGFQDKVWSNLQFESLRTSIGFLLNSKQLPCTSRLLTVRARGQDTELGRFPHFHGWARSM